MASEPDRLVVLDLDKTLVLRDKGKLEQVELPDYFSSLKSFPCGYATCYLRPGAEEFLEACYSMYRVGYFTSIYERNAKPILEAVLSEEQREQTLFTWYRDKCKPDPEAGTGDVKPWATVKLIEDVTSAYPEFEGRIVICDDSEEKLRFNEPRHNIIVPKFTPSSEEGDGGILKEVLEKIDLAFSNF